MKRYANYHGSMVENRNGPWVDIADVYKLEDRLADVTAERDAVTVERDLLRKLVLTVTNAGRSEAHRHAAVLALVEHELLYGRLDGTNTQPVGLLAGLPRKC